MMLIALATTGFAETYSVVGNEAALFGESWAPTNTSTNMTLTPAGYYVWTSSSAVSTEANVEFKVVKDYSYDNAWPSQNYYITVHSGQKLTVVFDPSNSSVFAFSSLSVTGDPASVFGESWSETSTSTDMTYDSTTGLYEWESGEFTLASSTTIEFKVVKDHAWDEAFPSSNYTLTAAAGIPYKLKVTFNPGTKAVTGELEYRSTDDVTGKPVWQQADASAANYIGHRKALIGNDCMVNKLINVVGVGSWISDLNNLTDEDLSNYATFPKIVDATVGVSPITSVRDTKNHYAAGTTAGFTLVAGSGSSLLSLDIVNAFAISFYKEGSLVGTVAVQAGQSVGGVGLSLITIPGSTDVSIDLSATAPGEFDEISLMPSGGVDLSAITSTQIKYAFVGDYVMNSITETSMQEYAASHGRLPFSLDQGKTQREGDLTIDAAVETGYWAGDDLINDDLTDGVAWGVLGVGSSLSCRVGAAINRNDPDQSMPFKKGSTVGFMYGGGSVLKLPVGSSVIIKLYKGSWVQKTRAGKVYYEYVQEEVQSETVNANVLNLSLISGGSQQVTITAKEDFSHAYISFATGLTIDLGGKKVYYGFICDPPVADHKCDLKLSASTNICANETEYQLVAEGGIPVTWSVYSQPAGGNASVSSEGLVTGFTALGDYVLQATAEDGCSDIVRVSYGMSANSTCDEPIQNNSVGAPNYSLSYIASYGGGALIDFSGSIEAPENVLNRSLEDYATYNANRLNLTVAENTPIIGVKNVNGTFSDGTNAHRIGFVVETKSSGLGLDALNLFSISTYKNGEETYTSLITENSAVKLKLIGSNEMQKMRFAIAVPNNVEFDEFVLWKTGVLNVSIEQFRIYYAFDEAISDIDELNPCIDPLGCDGTLLSSTYGVKLNSSEIQFAGAINVANIIDNLTFMVDDDIDTGVSITNTVSLGNGVVIAIDLGHVYTPAHQIGIVMDSRTYLAGVKAGNWLTLETYLNGVKQEQQDDWSVLGVNAIGYGDKSYIFMNPTTDYDEIRLTIGTVASLLNIDQKFYGVFTREDFDQDGVPDCLDDDSCVEEYTLDEEATVLQKPQDYPDGNLVLHRSLNLGDWNNIVLPVSLSWLQVRNAFGNNVALAKPKEVYNWRDRYTVMVYDPMDDEMDDEVAMEAGEYYLIMPYREPDMGYEEQYTALDGNTVNGPIYFIQGVTYERSIAEQPLEDKELTVRGKETWVRRRAPGVNDTNEGIVKIHGSNVYLDGSVNEKVKSGNYIYQAKSVLECVQEDTDMLGFRYYLENLTDLPLLHGQDVITGITDLTTAIEEGPKGTYMLDGRKVEGDVSTLPAGVYIIDGKKVIIRTK